MRKWADVILSLIVFCSALMGTACSKSPQQTLTLDWKPEPEFGGFYQAQVSGAFKAHGLDLQIQSAGEGAPTWQLVDTGKTEFATTAGDQVLIARTQGADIVSLFAVYQTFPQGIMVHKARGFTKIDDVFTHDGTLAAEEDTWLKFLNAKFTPFKVKEVGYSGGIGPFLAKPDYSQQCFVTSEPLQAAAQGGDPQTFLIAKAGYNPYTTVLICKGDLVHKDPARVKAMVLACREGWRAYLDDPSAANAEMGKLNHDMDAATFAKAAKAQAPLIETDETRKSTLGVMTAERWALLGQQLVTLKVIDKAPAPESCFVDADKLTDGH
jgi:NitT/TauT family transport system substrate-binding protein